MTSKIISPPPIIEVSNLTISIVQPSHHKKTKASRAISFDPHKDDSRVVRGVSFAVESNKVLGIIGESGAGKTLVGRALMRILPDAAFLSPDTQINFLPQTSEHIDIAHLSDQDKGMQRIRGKDIAMIFQEPMAAFSPLYTVGQQIIESVQHHLNVDTAQARAMGIDMFSRLHIPHPEKCFDQYIFELSGGLRQRAMIAVALVMKPALLIADEPTTALDVTVQAQIIKTLMELQSQMSMSTIFISHDLPVIAQVADDIAVMKSGEIVEIGSVQDIIHCPQHPYTQKLIASIPAFSKASSSSSSLVPKSTATPPTTNPHGSISDPKTSQSTDERVLLEVRGVSVEFQGQRKKWWSWSRETMCAVYDASLTVNQGETLAIIGQSGAGKSTLGRAMIRAGMVTRGNIIFHPPDGSAALDIHGLPERALRGARHYWQMIFQDPYSSLNPRMNIYQAIAEPLQVSTHPYTSQEIDQKVRKIADLCQVARSHLARFPHAFSGGQRQRICIARALITRPSLVVCDEPVSALDLSVQSDIIELMVDLKCEFNLAYILITHNMAILPGLANRVAVMCGGKILEIGDTNQILYTPSHPYTQELMNAIPKLPPAPNTSKDDIALNDNPHTTTQPS